MTCDVFCRSRSGTLLATGRSESKCSAGFTNADVKVGTQVGVGGGGGSWEVWGQVFGWFHECKGRITDTLQVCRGVHIVLCLFMTS